MKNKTNKIKYLIVITIVSIAIISCNNSGVDTSNNSLENFHIKISDMEKRVDTLHEEYRILEKELIILREKAKNCSK